MIEELKIAVDRIKESYENKVDQMENVIFDCREREREHVKFMTKRRDSLRTKEV